jgi:nitrate reductase (cytochrome), electron transfer subunit
MSEENKPNAFVAVSIIGTFIILAVIISQSIEGRLSKSDEHAHHSVLDTISKTMERKEENTSALSYSRDIRKDGAKIRTLKEFYSRRAYPGAPPVIPHAVEKDGIIADRCLTCHENGGYVQSFKAYAPVSPHPEKENCRQCHVPVVEKELFVKSDWVFPNKPKLKVTALSGSPPRMPHGLQLRENCLACHGGPAAVEEIRVSHPERENCQQCHVPQVEKEIFKSSLGLKNP